MVLPWRDTDLLQYGCDCLGQRIEMLCPYSTWPLSRGARCHSVPLWFRPLGDAYHAI